MDPWSAAITAAITAVSPYVAHVEAINEGEGRAVVGSGFAIDRFHVVTHGPLCQSGDEIKVSLGNGSGARKMKAEIVARDPLYYISVLRLDGRIEGEPQRFAHGVDARSGLLCLAVGDPFGYDRTVTLGVVCSSDRTIYRPERFPVDGLIVTDARIHAGNIGGPLVSLEGEILGMSGMPWANGLSLAVQADVVLRLANQIIEFGRATHPWLGFSGQPEVIDPALVSLFDLPARGGVVVSRVADGGPGERAGVQVYDMVVRVDGRPTRHLGAIRAALASRRPGDAGTLVVLRGSSLEELVMPVEEIPSLGDE